MIIQHTANELPAAFVKKTKPKNGKSKSITRLPVNGLSKQMSRISLKLQETFRNPPDNRCSEGYLLFQLQTMVPRPKVKTVEKLLWFLSPWLRGFIVWTYFSKTTEKVVTRKRLINNAFHRAKVNNRFGKVLAAAKSIKPAISIEEFHEIGYGLPDSLAQDLYKAYRRYLMDERWKSLGRKWGFSEAEVEKLVSDEPVPREESTIVRFKSPYETATEGFEKAAIGLPTKKRNELYLTMVHLPFINRLRRAYRLAEAEYHGIPEFIGRGVAKEITEAGLIHAGPYSLYPLPDMLKEAEVPPILNLYIGCELKNAMCWKSKEWQVRAIRFGHDLGPIGFKREFTAYQLAAFSPVPTPESALEIMQEAGIANDESDEVLALFKQFRESEKSHR